MPTVYFAGSIRGGRDDAVLYAQIIALLQERFVCTSHTNPPGQPSHSHARQTVLTEHVGAVSLGALGESNMSEGDIHDRGMPDRGAAQRTHPQLNPSPCVPSRSPMVEGVRFRCRRVHHPIVGSRIRDWYGKDCCAGVSHQQTETPLFLAPAHALAQNKPTLCLFRPSPGKCMSCPRIKSFRSHNSNFLTMSSSFCHDPGGAWAGVRRLYRICRTARDNKFIYRLACHLKPQPSAHQSLRPFAACACVILAICNPNQQVNIQG